MYLEEEIDSLIYGLIAIIQSEGSTLVKHQTIILQNTIDKLELLKDMKVKGYKDDTDQESDSRILPELQG